MTLKVFTTFSGIGSAEIALRNIKADYEVVGISEVDRYAILAYDAIHTNENPLMFDEDTTKEDILEEFSNKNIAYNFSTGESEVPKKIEDIFHLYSAHLRSKNWGDIRKIDETTLPDFDLFTYSFPCKNISIAGRQEGLDKNSDTQSSLLWECERIIEHKRPKYLLMENVKNLVGRNHIDDFNDWIGILEDLGYRSTWEVLDAVDFGLPQHRERVMMMSVLDETEIDYQMPDGDDIRSAAVLQHWLQSPLNVPTNLYYDAFKYKHIPLDMNREAHELIRVGNISNNKGVINEGHSNTRVYSAYGYCPTLNSMNGGDRQPKIMTEGVVRRMSPIECWRVMGYYDTDFKKAQKYIPANKLYERAGRGIAVPMLEEIFKNLLQPEDYK